MASSRQRNKAGRERRKCGAAALNEAQGVVWSIMGKSGHLKQNYSIETMLVQIECLYSLFWTDKIMSSNYKSVVWNKH